MRFTQRAGVEPRDPHLGRESPEIFKAGPGGSSRRGGTQGPSDFQTLRPPTCPRAELSALATRGTGGRSTAPGPSAPAVLTAGLPRQGEARLELKAGRRAGSERSRPVGSPPHPSGASPGCAGLLPPRPRAPSGPGASRRGPCTHPLPEGAKAACAPTTPLPEPPPREVGLHFPQSFGGVARA